MLAFLRNHWSRHLLIALFAFSAFFLALCLFSGLANQLHDQELLAKEAQADETYHAGEQAIERQDNESARNQFGGAITIYCELIHAWGEKNDRAIDSWRGDPRHPRPSFPGDRIIQYHKTIRQLESKLAKALAKRGFTYFEKGDFSNALVDFNEAVRLDSENPIAHEGRAKTYRALGKDAKAEIDEDHAKFFREQQARKSERSK